MPATERYQTFGKFVVLGAYALQVAGYHGMLVAGVLPGMMNFTKIALDCLSPLTCENELLGRIDLQEIGSN